MESNTFIPYRTEDLTLEAQKVRVESFYKTMSERRSVRHFSNREVDEKIIRTLINTAGTAPSGANKQPWTFCAISSPEIKQKIREAAEKEEYENYHGRMSDEWLQDLQKFDTNWVKEFLTEAPWLIVIFKKSYDIDKNGTKSKNYYVQESVGIASGIFITAVHMAGLVTLTHTPSPMGFLQEILGRPENEKPFLLLPVGYPAENCLVPDIKRKSENEISLFF
ncbi:MAG: nitroreductase family protein [Saprospiraceae bacterium]|nr:nitroreductase family protein [Saprospiraceae bacterium]